MFKYIFVADFFREDYSGGAELTSEAIISVHENIIKLRSQELTKELILANQDKVWIFGNFSLVPAGLLLEMVKSSIIYHIIEYDFKFCSMRSPGKHKAMTGTCNCFDTSYGKLIALFFSGARKLWFMSEKQSLIYKNNIPHIDDDNVNILSSVFKLEHLEYMKQLNEKTDKTNSKYLILDSRSWIKGVDDCIKYANNNNLDYELVSGLSYENMLRKIRESKGLIFLPKAADTCPRIVIEAKILECDIRINENVLHKDEKWYKDSDMIKYLSKRSDVFWEGVSK